MSRPEKRYNYANTYMYTESMFQHRGFHSEIDFKQHAPI